MNCRTIFVTISLLLPISYAQIAVAEQEKEADWKAEQRESGGNLLKFFFGDEDEEDGVDSESENNLEENVTTNSPEVPVEGDAGETKDDGVSVPGQISVQELEPKKAVITQGQDRGGLVPPPGFIVNLPPEKDASGADVIPEVNALPEAEPLPKTQVLPETQVSPEKAIVVEKLSTPSGPLENQSITSEQSFTLPVSPKEPSSPISSELDRLANENPVVAVVEGDRIYWADILQAARKLPEQYQGQLETMFPILLDRAIDLKLLAHAGANANLDENDAVKRRLVLAEERIIRDAFLEQELDEMISESMLRERYFDLLRENIVNAEVRARHILVETRNEALALIIALENGADFPFLAKKFSRGPSAEKGGDLGWFRRKDMDPEFAASAFSLKIGMITKVPVATEFGWHVIKLEDQREVKQPTYESMRSEIKEQLSIELIAKMVRELRKEADISVFPAK